MTHREKLLVKILLLVAWIIAEDGLKVEVRNLANHINQANAS